MRTTLLVALFPIIAAAQVTKTTSSVSVANCNPSPAQVSYQVDVYRPSGAGPFALVGLAHGFQNGKENGEQLARLIAARGVVVVAPQFPLLLALQCGYSDHARNATILLAAMDQQIALGDIDTQRLGVAGHSAGGLSAFLAASQRAFQAVVLLDAVDNMMLGSAQVPNVTEPVLSMLTEPSQCNTQNNSAQWYAGLTGLKGTMHVVGASHCEPQDPVNPACSGACSGTIVPARQALFKKYTVAFFDRFLNGVSAPCIETIAAADQQAGVISMVDLQLGLCVVPVDAGVDAGGDAGLPIDAGTDAGVVVDAGTDAGVVDAGVVDAGSLDAGLADAGLADAGSTDAGLQSGDAGVTGEPVQPVGCGCTALPSAAVLLALAMLTRRRR